MGWTPRGDWARGEREHFDDESFDSFLVIGAEGDLTGTSYGPSMGAFANNSGFADEVDKMAGEFDFPYERSGHMHHNVHEHPHDRPWRHHMRPQRDELDREP
jgi:hypothetical protein